MGPVLLNELGNYTLNKSVINDDLKYDFESIWVSISNIAKMNDNGEIIANGKTIYGEEHAMLLVPKNKS